VCYHTYMFDGRIGRHFRFHTSQLWLVNPEPSSKMTTNFSKDPLVVRQFACRYPRNSVRLCSEQGGIGKHADGAKSGRTKACATEIGARLAIRTDKERQGLRGIYLQPHDNGLTSEL